MTLETFAAKPENGLFSFYLEQYRNGGHTSDFAFLSAWIYAAQAYGVITEQESNEFLCGLISNPDDVMLIKSVHTP